MKMKGFICVFFVVIMCLGFVGCKEKESSPPANTEKATPHVEETVPPVEIPAVSEETVPSVEILPSPEERQPQGEQEGSSDVSHDN